MSLFAILIADNRSPDYPYTVFQKSLAQFSSYENGQDFWDTQQQFISPKYFTGLIYDGKVPAECVTVNHGWGSGCSWPGSDLREKNKKKIGWI